MVFEGFLCLSLAWIGDGHDSLFSSSALEQPTQSTDPIAKKMIWLHIKTEYRYREHIRAKCKLIRLFYLKLRNLKNKILVIIRDKIDFLQAISRQTG